MNTTYLQLANGTQYQVSDFWQQRGIIEVKLSLLGVQYPAVERWEDCTLVIGDKRFEHVTAGITTVRIEKPLNGIDPCTTEYTVTMAVRRGSDSPKD